MLLPQTTRGGAEHVAHRVLDAVEALDIPHEMSPTAHHVTVSIGVASYDQESACWVEPSAESRFKSVMPRTASQLLQSADQALYLAKRSGRAQAWRLDIDDVDAPLRAQEIASTIRAARGRDAG